MSLASNATKRENKNTKKNGASDGHSLTEKSPKNKNVKEVPPSEDVANITVRLSDHGVIKRSPSEFELEIQSGRVLYILENVIEKIQIALSLSSLLKNNAALLRQFLQDPETEFIKSICLKYRSTNNFGQRKQSAPFQTISEIVDKISLLYESKRSMQKRSYGGREQDRLIDPHMTQVMEMLCKSHGLKETVLADFNKLADAPSVVFVTSIERLKDIAEKKLATSALQRRAREKSLSQAWKANSEAEENIEKIKQQLEKQRQELGNQVKIKNAIVTDYQSRVEALESKFKDDIQHKIQKSEKAMSQESNASAVRQADLAVESKAVTQQYEGLLSQHLAYEKGLRAKRFKVETQLSSWLAKFDADIGERQAEFEEITRGFEEEKTELEALQQKFDEQEEEYIVLMTEKEEEERRIWEEKAYQFMKGRSARIIQRLWRAYRLRKLEKKKAKKTKGKAKKEKSTEVIEGGEEPKASAGKEKKGDDKNKKQADKKGKKDESEQVNEQVVTTATTLAANVPTREATVDQSAEATGVTGVDME